MDAVPLPWCTSRSITATRGGACPAESASCCSVRAATAMSLNTQKPPPLSALAWCVPPARLAAMPSDRARRAAATVAPTERRERSTMASLQGKPISRSAFGSMLPLATAAM